MDAPLGSNKLSKNYSAGIAVCGGIGIGIGLNIPLLIGGSSIVLEGSIAVELKKGCPSHDSSINKKFPTETVSLFLHLNIDNAS